MLNCKVKLYTLKQMYTVITFSYTLTALYNMISFVLYPQHVLDIKPYLKE